MAITRYLSLFADFLNSSGVLGYSGGGTGISSTPSAGQIDIGNGTGFTRTTITPGTGINVSNGPGTITISTSGPSAGSVDWINVKSAPYNAAGDGVTDDTSAINAAIAVLNASSYGGVLYFPAGTYKITAVLTTITRSGVYLLGDNDYASIIAPTGVSPAGDNGIITFKSTTSGSRLYGGGITNLQVRCTSMSSGTVIVNDYTKDFFISNVALWYSYNGIYMRQYNSTTLQNMRMESIAGSYGIKCYGDGSTRNGETDRSDILDLSAITMIGGAPTYTPNLIWLDGFIQTVNLSNLNLSTGNYGIYCSNTPSVASGNWVSFVVGNNIEIQNSINNAIYGIYLYDGYFNNIAVNTTTSGDGILFSSNCTRISLSSGVVENCHFHGVNVNGATYVSLNNLYSKSNGSSGIYTPSPSASVMVTGGAYYSNSRYGWDGSTGTNLAGAAVNFQGNTLGSTFGTISLAAAFV